MCRIAKALLLRRRVTRLDRQLVEISEKLYLGKLDKIPRELGVNGYTDVIWPHAQLQASSDTTNVLVRYIEPSTYSFPALAGV